MGAGAAPSLRPSTWVWKSPISVHLACLVHKPPPQWGGLPMVASVPSSRGFSCPPAWAPPCNTHLGGCFSSGLDYTCPSRSCPPRMTIARHGPPPPLPHTLPSLKPQGTAGGCPMGTGDLISHVRLDQALEGAGLPSVKGGGRPTQVPLLPSLTLPHREAN